MIPISTDPVDVLVVGGGAAGVAAAVGAAEAGASVALIEKVGTLGGLGTSAEVSTVCGLFLRRTDGVVAWAMDGLPREVGERVQHRSGREVAWARGGLAFQPYLAHELGAVLVDVLEARRVAPTLHTTLVDLRRVGDGWVADTLSWDRRVSWSARAVVDASGVAWAAAAAGADLLPDEERQAPALVATLAGLPSDDGFALRTWLTKELVRGRQEGTAPAAAAALSLVPGTHHAGTVKVKLGIAVRVLGEVDEPTRLELRARRELDEAVAWLRTLPGFDRVAVVAVAATLGIRTGRRARGEVTVESDHVLAAAACADGIARGAWPVERWSVASQPSLRHLPEGAACEIPVGALCAAGVPGLFLAGRVLSASEEAMASLRVIGTCIGTGYAAGHLAAAHAAGLSRGEAVARIRAAQLGGAPVP